MMKIKEKIKNANLDRSVMQWKTDGNRLAAFVGDMDA